MGYMREPSLSFIAMSSQATKRITRSMSTRAAKRQRLHEQLIALGIEETYPVLLTVLSIPELIQMLPACSLVKLKATSSDVRTRLSTKTVGIRIWAEWFDKQYDTRLLPEDCTHLVKYFPAGPFPFDVKWFKTIPRSVVSAEFVRVASRIRRDNSDLQIVRRLLDANHIPTAMWIVKRIFWNGEIISKSLSVLRNKSEVLDDFLLEHRNFFFVTPSDEINQAYFQWLQSLDASNLKVKFTLYECYRYGRGTDANPNRALNLLVECARGGYRDSTQQIYDICQYGGIRNAPHASSVRRWLLESSGHSLPESDRNVLFFYCMKHAIGFPRAMNCMNLYHMIARQQILRISPRASHLWDRPENWAARNDPRRSIYYEKRIREACMQ
ncbi:uncharacterized protein BJ171DRAFT_544426, partial [Polychytrium aggregatum]|uniref:uncharacterized protein n=1 Tax=Polychytrium aggregatum TaxID=110093 RepID=UPI0022FE8B61